MTDQKYKPSTKIWSPWPPNPYRRENLVSVALVPRVLIRSPCPRSIVGLHLLPVKVCTILSLYFSLDALSHVFITGHKTRQHNRLKILDYDIKVLSTNYANKVHAGDC